MDQNSNALPVLIDAAWPRKSLPRAVFLVVAGSLLIALLAQLEIPLQPAFSPSGPQFGEPGVF